MKRTHRPEHNVRASTIGLDAVRSTRSARSKTARATRTTRRSSSSGPYSVTTAPIVPCGAMGPIVDPTRLISIIANEFKTIRDADGSPRANGTVLVKGICANKLDEDTATSSMMDDVYSRANCVVTATFASNSSAIPTSLGARGEHLIKRAHNGRAPDSIHDMRGGFVYIVVDGDKYDRAECIVGILD